MNHVWLETGLFVLKLFWLVGLVPALVNTLNLITAVFPAHSSE